MSEKKYRDLDSGKVVTLDADAYARVADVKSKKLGGARFQPVDNKVDVAVTDSAGQVRTHSMDAASAHHAVSNANPNIQLLTDQNRQPIEEFAAAQLEDQTWRDIARGQTAEAFFGNVIPGVRALDRLEMTPEQAAHDAYMTQLQDEENPIAAGAGTVAGLVATSLIPIPGLGAASGLFRGARAGKSAMSLMGFADEVGNVLSRGLVGAGAPGAAAKFAGTMAAGAAVNIPLSIQFQAAQAVDYDKPLTIEAFTRDLGTNVLIGAAFDAAFPFAKGAWNVVKMASPLRAGITFAGPSLRSVANIADRIFNKNATQHYAGAHMSPGRVVNMFDAVRGVFTKNTPRRMAGGAILDDAASKSAALGKALDNAIPSKARSASAVTKLGAALDEMAAQLPDVAASPHFATARVGADNLRFIEKDVKQAAAKMSRSSDTLVGYLRSPDLRNVKFQGTPKGLNIELNSVANRLADELSTIGVDDKLVKQLRGLISNVKGPPSTGIQRMLEFRNRVLIDAMKSDVPASRAAAEMVKKNIDTMLQDARVVGSGAGDLADILKATDDALESANSLRAGLDDLINIDKHTSVEAFGAGKMAHSLQRARDAMEALSNKGVVSSADARFVGTAMEGGNTLLGLVAPKLETVAAINSLRGMAGQEFKAVMHTPLAAGEGTATYGMFEAAERWLADTKAILDGAVDDFTNPTVKRGAVRTPMTTGIYQFRSMQSLQEKEDAYNELVANVEAVTASDDTLIGAVERVTTGMQQDPELADGVAAAAVARANYLKQHFPQGPQGVVKYRPFKPSPSEISNVLEIAGALDDPLSVMDSALRGTMRPSGLKAVQDLYPNLMADMQVQISERFLADPAVYGALPYNVRLSVDRFLGGGYEPSATPQAIVNFQNRSAQTQAQDAALRGSGAMRAPQNGSGLASDNLANF